MRIGVIGAYGSMGTEICATVEAAADLKLVAKLGRGDSLKTLIDSQVDIVVDVTEATAARHNVAWAALHGMQVVVGTSGFSDEDKAMFDRAFREADRSCFLVPNFSMGAVLMMKFAKEAARYMPDVEIIELHRAEKKDAPSGTAKITAERLHDVTGRDVPIHSIRLPGLLAHQEVMFGAKGETLTIRHDSLHRSSFMPGVLRALRHLDSLPPGLTVGLEAVL